MHGARRGIASSPSGRSLPFIVIAIVGVFCIFLMCVVISFLLTAASYVVYGTRPSSACPPPPRPRCPGCPEQPTHDELNPSSRECPKCEVCVECPVSPLCDREETHLDDSVLGVRSVSEDDPPDMIGHISCGDVCPGSRARCFFGKCLCKPGYFGPRCIYRRPISIVKTFECPNERVPTTPVQQTLDCLKSDWSPKTGGPLRALQARVPEDDWCVWMCHESEGGMVDVIDKDRWALASKNEYETWKRSVVTVSQRSRLHSDAFDSYKLVPEALGDLIEIGCGPFTQTKTLLEQGKRPRSITLTDPNLQGYIDHVKATTYKNGTLLGHEVTLESAMGEDLLEIYGDASFDTLVMINVIEHSFSPLRILETNYRLLKPGGLMIFREKVYAEPMSSLQHEEIIRHPIRVQPHVFDHYFKVLFDFVYVRVNPEWTFIGYKRKEEIQSVVS